MSVVWRILGILYRLWLVLSYQGDPTAMPSHDRRRRRWADLSGRGNDAVQSDEGRQPKLWEQNGGEPKS